MITSIVDIISAVLLCIILFIAGYLFGEREQKHFHYYAPPPKPEMKAPIMKVIVNETKMQRKENDNATTFPSSYGNKQKEGI